MQTNKAGKLKLNIVYRNNVRVFGKTSTYLQNIRVGFMTLLLVLGSLFSFAQESNHLTKTDRKTIYLFSGLGADSTPFANLKLPGYHKVYISWIPPLRDETLAQYAGRIKSQITAENPHFIGLSFGGILAIEVAKQVKVDKMVLISSARTRDDLSRVQNFFMKLGLYRIIPAGMIRHTNFLTYLYFGARSEREKVALMKLLQGTDVALFRWGLKSIADWDNKVAPDRTIQIHGTADRVIAYRHVCPDYSIKGGGHLMVINQADTISKIVMKYFKE
jgi:pimeloyl-ACP methyl ester carboxylesterase